MPDQSGRNAASRAPLSSRKKKKKKLFLDEFRRGILRRKGYTRWSLSILSRVVAQVVQRIKLSTQSLHFASSKFTRGIPRDREHHLVHREMCARIK